MSDEYPGAGFWRSMVLRVIDAIQYRLEAFRDRVLPAPPPRSSMGLTPAKWDAEFFSQYVKSNPMAKHMGEPDGDVLHHPPR